MASDGSVAARLFVEVGARGLNETTAGLGRMDSAVRGTSAGIGGMVKMIGGIYAVKKAFDGTIGSAISWESEFAGVVKTVEGTESELRGLEDQLLQMNRTMPISTTELAGIAEAAGALGIATGDIAEFTETVAMIGETTDVSSDQAATALGKLSNVLGLTADDYDNFGAALVDLGNKGASTEQEILGIAERAGAGASLIDIAADATLGWSAAVANLGIEAEAGGSALQRFFLGMTEHVAKAGEELAAIAQTAGMTASEFQRAFGEDSSAALQTFIGGMQDLTQAEQLALLELLGFSDVRISRTLLGLAGNTKNLNDALTTGAGAWAANTALVEEYGKRADTTASKIEVLGNRLGDLGRRLGESQGGPVNLAIGAADLSLSGYEKVFLDFDLMFDENVARAVSNMEDKGNFLRNNFLTELLIGDEVRNEIRDNMIEWGTGLQETIDLMDLGLTPDKMAAAKAWEDYTKAITPSAQDAGASVAGGFSQGASEMSEEMVAEMEAVQQAAVDGAQATVDGIAGLFETDTSAQDAATAFVESIVNPFADVDQIKTVVDHLLLDEIPQTFEDGSTVTSLKSLEWVNAQLEIFDTLQPGMLARGQDGGSGLLAGMSEYDDPLREFATTLAGDLLNTMTLDEALRELGYDALADYFQGMGAAENANKGVAPNIASRAVAALTLDASAGGWAIISSWIGGMENAYTNNQGRVWGIVGGVKRALGGSLPTEGPLAGGAGSGGVSIAESWMNALVGTIDRGLPQLSGALGGVGTLLGSDMGVAPGVGTGGSRPIADSAPTTVNVYLTVQGDLKANESTLPGTLKRAVYAAGLTD